MKADRIFKELMYIESQKGTVWDDRKRDLGYIDHRNAIKKIKKKVDNECPVISSKKFFPQMKYIANQWKMEERIRANLLILRELNKIQRSRGNIDNFNPKTSYLEHMKKIQERENEYKLIEKVNKIHKKILTNAVPKVESTRELLNRFYKVNRRAIYRSAKYKIVLDSLKHPKMRRLEAPEGPRVFIDILTKDEKFFGRLEILINHKTVSKEVQNFFLDLCENSYKDCYIHKIMKNIFIETGDVEFSKKFFPQPNSKTPSHDRAGIVSMKLNDDGSLSPKFVITMQPMKIFDDNHIVVGRVIDGNNFIIDLDAHGTKFGMPEKMFFITVTAIKK